MKPALALLLLAGCQSPQPVRSAAPWPAPPIHLCMTGPGDFLLWPPATWPTFRPGDDGWCARWQTWCLWMFDRDGNQNVDMVDYAEFQLQRRK